MDGTAPFNRAPFTSGIGTRNQFFALGFVLALALYIGLYTLFDYYMGDAIRHRHEQIQEKISKLEKLYAPQGAKAKNIKSTAQQVEVRYRELYQEFFQRVSFLKDSAKEQDSEKAQYKPSDLLQISNTFEEKYRRYALKSPISPTKEYSFAELQAKLFDIALIESFINGVEESGIGNAKITLLEQKKVPLNLLLLGDTLAWEFTVSGMASLGTLSDWMTTLKSGDAVYVTQAVEFAPLAGMGSTVIDNLFAFKITVQTYQFSLKDAISYSRFHQQIRIEEHDDDAE